MQSMQAALVAVRSSVVRGRLSICISRRQASRRPELMQRKQKARVAFHSSDVRGRPSICTHRHEVGKRQTAKTVAISLKCSIVCRTQHIFHGVCRFRPRRQRARLHRHFVFVSVSCHAAHSQVGFPQETMVTCGHQEERRF
jgi:hypothetical protein